MRLSRRALAVHSLTDGPWTAVSRLRKIEVVGGNKEDQIEIICRKHDMKTPPEPVRICGSSERLVRLPTGEIMIRRLSGDNPITVVAYCERF